MVLGTVCFLNLNICPISVVAAPVAKAPTIRSYLYDDNSVLRGRLPLIGADEARSMVK